MNKAAAVLSRLEVTLLAAVHRAIEPRDVPQLAWCWPFKHALVDANSEGCELRGRMDLVTRARVRSLLH